MTAVGVLVPCPRSAEGKLTLTPDDVKVWTTRSLVGWVFHCPICGEPHRNSAAVGQVILMIDAGCPVEEEWENV